MKRMLCLFALLLLCLAPQAFAEGNPVPAVGAVVVMGSYEQDKQLDNGAEPIEWIVLEVKGSQAMLLSKYCIDTVIFYPKRVAMYWGKSDLRVWMNSTFLDTAFTPEEQNRILTTVVENSNPHGMKGAGDDTLDKVYLLSKPEVLRFFPEMADRVAYPTEYAKSKGCTVSPTTGSCRWWTRTSGARKMDMCGMRLDGRISAYGMQDVDWPTNTMRPVMWVQFDE